MDRPTHTACVQNQVAAAHWHDQSMHWAMRAAWPTRQESQAMAAFFAAQYQLDAARLYAADRRLRGLEA